MRRVGRGDVGRIPPFGELRTACEYLGGCRVAREGVAGACSDTGTRREMRIISIARVDLPDNAPFGHGAATVAMRCSERSGSGRTTETGGFTLGTFRMGPEFKLSFLPSFRPDLKKIGGARVHSRSNADIFPYQLPAYFRTLRCTWRPAALVARPTGTCFNASRQSLGD